MLKRISYLKILHSRISNNNSHPTIHFKKFFQSQLPARFLSGTLLQLILVFIATANTKDLNI